jgi:hypothetical protein
MSKIISEEALHHAILQLEHQQAIEKQLLKAEVQAAYESIRPINIIKNTFAEAADSKELKEGALDVSIGIAAGYLSKILFKMWLADP